MDQRGSILAANQELHALVKNAALNAGAAFFLLKFPIVANTGDYPVIRLFSKNINLCKTLIVSVLRKQALIIFKRERSFSLYFY